MWERLAYRTAVRKKRSTLGRAVVSLVLGGIVLLFVVGQGAVATGVQMDLSSGDKRRVLYIFNTEVRTRPDTPMWFAEYASERRGDWATVSRKVRWFGGRVNWKWGATHWSMLAFGEWIRETDAGEDVRRAAGEELLRLTRSEENPWFLIDVMSEVSSDMVEGMERGEPLDAEGVRAAFRRAEAGRRAAVEP